MNAIMGQYKFGGFISGAARGWSQSKKLSYFKTVLYL
jgi:hypothetical protein